MKLYKDLTRDEKIALAIAEIDGRDLESKTISVDAEWHTVTRPWYDHTYYRVKKTQDSIDWSHVLPDYKWMARDECGCIYFYMDEPELMLDENMWYGKDSAINNAFASYKRGTTDWKESKVRRPE